MHYCDTCGYDGTMSNQTEMCRCAYHEWLHGYYHESAGFHHPECPYCADDERWVAAFLAECAEDWE